MDADMILEISDEFQKSSLTADAYRIERRPSQDDIYYQTGLVRGSLNITSKGVTHEYYDIPAGSVRCNLKGLFIKHVADGGCRSE